MNHITSYFKEKKLNKKKVFGLSVINNVVQEKINIENIDFFRFDLDEFALLHGFKSSQYIKEEFFYHIIQNYTSTKYFAVDLPVTSLYTGSSISLEKITNFITNNKADFLILNGSFNIGKNIKTILGSNIPFALEVNYQNNQNEEAYFISVFNMIKEYESNNGFLAILNGFQSDFYKYTSQNLSIPVLSNVRNINADGYYARFSKLFGLLEDPCSYLNMSELLYNSYEDFVVGR